LRYAQKIRALLFYISLFMFLGGLPFILSFALGYKFNSRTFKFTKAGLIVLKTQPQGLRVYLDGKLLQQTTPATIDELLPGEYAVRLELENYYPWSARVTVEAGKVTRLDKIMLFAQRTHIRQLSRQQFSSFWADALNNTIYYFNEKEPSIYKSGLDGEQFEKIADLPQITPPAAKWVLSADREQLLYFNRQQIAVAYLAGLNAPQAAEDSFILNYPGRNIIDAFWHSDNYHIILISAKNIEVLEAEPGAVPLVLVTLNKRNTSGYYDIKTDMLYYIDSQRASDGNLYDNLYKIHLGSRLYPLHELMRPRPAQEEEEGQWQEREP